MLHVLYELFRAWSWGRAAGSDAPDDRCVACDGTDLRALGERAYECRACGYQGGSGMAAMQQSSREAAWKAWPPAKRRESGVADLREARILLISAQGAMRGASSAAHLDLIGLGGSSSGGAADEKQVRLTNALGEMEQARALLRDAARKLDGVGVGDRDVPIDFATWSLDIHMDGAIADLLMIRRISEASAKVDALLADVERTLREITGEAP